MVGFDISGPWTLEGREGHSGGTLFPGDPVPIREGSHHSYHSWVGLEELIRQGDVPQSIKDVLSQILDVGKACSASDADVACSRSLAVPMSAQYGSMSSSFTSPGCSPDKFVKYAPSDYVRVDIKKPLHKKPLDVIRKFIARHSKSKPWAKRRITGDTIQTKEWHFDNTEHMVRTHFELRGVGRLLGNAVYGSESGLDYVEFEYLQPEDLGKRGVRWLSDPNVKYYRGGHGTYWEMATKIIATGTFSPSTDGEHFGMREWHGKKGLGDGVYWTPQFDAWAGHYAWGCNVFGNNCFYGIGFRTIACEDHILKRFWHPTKSTKIEVVSAPEGIVITHVLVVVNKTIEAGHSRARYFSPTCEFGPEVPWFLENK